MSSFLKKYPYISAWVGGEGYITIGDDEHYNSWIRVFDHGGMICEIEDAKNIDEALNKLEEYFRDSFEDEWGYKIEI